MLLHAMLKSGSSTGAPSINDVLDITVGALGFTLAWCGLLYIVYNWNGSRVDRLLVRIADVLDERDQDSPG